MGKERRKLDDGGDEHDLAGTASPRRSSTTKETSSCSPATMGRSSTVEGMSSNLAGTWATRRSLVVKDKLELAGT